MAAKLNQSIILITDGVPLPQDDVFQVISQLLLHFPVLVPVPLLV